MLCRDGSYREEPADCTPSERIEGHLRLRLSKRLSGILRHFPEKYGIHLDPHGWARVDDILRSLKRDPQFSWVREWHITALATLDPKGRFELRGGRIRARYGHSVRVRIEPLEGPLPPRLYHATPPPNLPSIMREGLKPGKRTHVHMSDHIETALETGRRHHPNPILLEIDTRCLEERGIKVERRAPHIYVSPTVPPECIKSEKAMSKR